MTPHNFKVGDVVTLTCGGAPMTIADLNERDVSGQISCVFFLETESGRQWTGPHCLDVYPQQIRISTQESQVLQ